MDSERASAALTEAADALLEALACEVSKPVLRERLLAYDSAFERWVEACGLDRSRSSFEQRVQ